MSPVQEPLTAFERNARTVLEEAVQRIDARTRSRLNQARQAALAAAQAPRRAWWRSFTLMPAAGAAAAALLVAFMLWHRQPAGELPVLEGPHATAEDVDLLADSEALELVEGGDGSFYEWAASQSDNGASDS
jgi:ferric-dicitrate binding protein FerR (iron transport regulator)